MNRFLLILITIVMISSVAFAEEVVKDSPSPAKEIAEGINKTGEFIGTVVSVTVADPINGISQGSVKVADDMGNPVSYTVNSAATIMDASLNAITLNQLKEGAIIKVQSTEAKDGTKEAKSINVI